MNLADRIEKRRFVGREFLLWLWFESELFEATLGTEREGSFGFWLEGQLVLSAGRETTRIKGSYPAGAREAKESLLLGKLPELAGIHLSWREQDFQFVLRAERMALSGLKLPTVLGADQEEAPVSLAPARPGKRKGKRDDDESEQDHEAFYERMMLTREVESLLESLYADFLRLRLVPAWNEELVPMLRAWVNGAEVDEQQYRAVRKRLLVKTTRAAKKHAATEALAP